MDLEVFNIFVIDVAALKVVAQPLVCCCSAVGACLHCPEGGLKFQLRLFKCPVEMAVQSLCQYAQAFVFKQARVLAKGFWEGGLGSRITVKELLPCFEKLGPEHTVK